MNTKELKPVFDSKENEIILGKGAFATVYLMENKEG